MKSHNESWVVHESAGRSLVVLLHLRDRYGLPVGRDIPRLVPHVERDQSMTTSRKAPEVEDAWEAAEMTDHPDLSITAVEWLLQLPTAQALGGLIRADERDADRWIENQKIDEMSALRNSAEERDNARERRSYINRIVERAESEIGKPLSPFILTINVLPLDGLWHKQPAPTRLLVSETLRSSEEMLSATLLPLVKRLGS